MRAGYLRVRRSTVEVAKRRCLCARGECAVVVRLVRNAAHFQWCGARLQTGLVSENESPAICSAKACRAFATWAVVWNNPRLHTPDREKVWVACGEHKQPLADYLAVRSFLKRVEPLGPV